MNASFTRLFALAAAAGFAGFSGLAQAQLEVLPSGEPPCVFSGRTQAVSALFRNPADTGFSGAIRIRLVQTSGIRLQVPAKETVLAGAPVAIPAVTAETRLLIEWLTDSRHVIGRTEVQAYPDNLLAALHPLAGADPLGVFDPQNLLKPLLQKLPLAFTDLENSDLRHFTGRLAIIGPFATRAQMRDGLARDIQALARRGTAVVWLQPPPPPGENLRPSFLTVPETTNALVIVQPEPVARLADNPSAQLNLVWFCQLAERPESAKFAELASQP